MALLGEGIWKANQRGGSKEDESTGKGGFVDEVVGSMFVWCFLDMNRGNRGGEREHVHSEGKKLEGHTLFIAILFYSLSK